MLHHKVRWIYLLTIMDMSLVDILLQSCKYVIFDPHETVLEVKRMKLNRDTEEFMINKMLTDQFSEMIREKKNRHIIYACRKSDPINILNQIREQTKDISPTSKFYFNLISDVEDHLKLSDFHSIYVQ